MRVSKIAYSMIEKAFQWVDIIREGHATNREVQCEGDRDETEDGRETWRAAFSVSPAGFKHRAAAAVSGVAKEKGFLLDVLGGILLGAHLEDGEPTDLQEGETAIFSSGGAQVRCTSTIVQIGSGSGGLLIRKDNFSTWWTNTPAANHAIHKHPGMPGPGTTGVPDTALGSVGPIEGSEGHTVK